MIKHTLTFEQSFVEATQEVQLSHHVDLTIMIGWKEVKVGVDGDVATRRKKMILTSGLWSAAMQDQTSQDDLPQGDKSNFTEICFNTMKPL